MGSYKNLIDIKDKSIKYKKSFYCIKFYFILLFCEELHMCL